MPGLTVSPAEACALLKRGGVVAIPTETVYGLAAKATDPQAIERIFRVKNRPSTNPLICHFPSFDSTKPFLKPYPSYVNALQRYLMPGPVSFLLPLNSNSGLGHAVRGQANVIVRVPAHPVALEILACVGEPLAAPSANSSGLYSATTAQMVLSDLGDKIDGVVDGGASETGIESTILDCTREREVQILRPGAVGKKDLEEILRREQLNVEVTYANAVHPTPGHAHRHYAPRTPLALLDSIFTLPELNEVTGILASDEALAELDRLRPTAYANVISIGSEQDPAGIGRTLYAALAKLDTLQVKQAFIAMPNVTDADWRRALRYRLQKMTEPF